MSAPEELCPHCGAPRTAGYAACKFCKTPFVANTQTGAIPCPRCNTLNEMGAQRCVQCQTWVVVQCVFCHALSPHNVPACTKCNEAFAGAPQRFAERQKQQHLQQGLNIAGTVGNVAASFLGAAAGAGLFSGRSHHEHYGHQGGYGPPGYGPPQYGPPEYGPPGYGPPQYGPPPDDYPSEGAGIAQSNESSGGGFFSSLFGGGDSSDTGAGISQSDDSGSDSGAGISSSDDDSGGFFGGSDDS